MTTRILGPQPLPDDHFNHALRPTAFSEFIGQDQLLRNLSVFIQAARERSEALDHVLLYGPPGLGKTTLAHLISIELGVKFRMTAGPILTKPGDLAALLTNLQPRDVLFIDEIHRLPKAVEEMLYAAMEDYKIDIFIGEGPHARSVQLTLPRFTLVGATTRAGLLSAPLRDRFGILLPLTFYDPTELQKILQLAAQKLSITLDPAASHLLSYRCRGTPRIALRLLRRIRDFAQVYGVSPITLPLTERALKDLGITSEGLDPLDQRYLGLLAHTFKGGPVGADTLCAALSETRDTLEDVIEPYLLQQGFLQRTHRGRMLTDKGWAAIQGFSGETAPR